MENIRQLNALVDQATSESISESPNDLFNKILNNVNSRVDM